MSDDDQFDPFNSDKTVILPTPGGSIKPGTTTQIPVPSSQQPRQVPLSQTGINSQQGGLTPPKLAHVAAAERNSILGNSLALISYAAELRHLSSPPNTAQLFNDLALQIKEIGDNQKLAGQTDEIVITSRYLICSFIDEMVLNTPWGSTSQWSTQSLLSYFHKEAQGGTKFFDILKKIEQQSAIYIDLIELVYVCLSYGYLGKYRLQADGANQISSIQENLFQYIRQVRQHQDLPLSTVTEGIETKQSNLSQGKALLLTGILSISVLIIAFGMMLFDLNDKSDPVALKALELRTKMPSLIQKKRVVSPSKKKSLPLDLLASDLAQGSIDIQKMDDGIKFILFGDGLFQSGSIQIINKGLVQRVASVIQETSGPIKVIGHSDNIPIRTMEFPSNFQLSKKRAESISIEIRQQLTNRNIEIEGLADLEPLVPNNNSKNRAKNRRVEILLFSN